MSESAYRSVNCFSRLLDDECGDAEHGANSDSEDDDSEERDQAEVIEAGEAFAALGGPLPVAVALQEANPEAEVMLLGVEEPGCHIHSPDESLDPAEFERTALALALFLSDYATSQANGPAGR